MSEREARMLLLANPEYEVQGSAPPETLGIEVVGAQPQPHLHSTPTRSWRLVPERAYTASFKWLLQIPPQCVVSNVTQEAVCLPVSSVFIMFLAAASAWGTSNLLKQMWLKKPQYSSTCSAKHSYLGELTQKSPSELFGSCSQTAFKVLSLYFYNAIILSLKLHV